MALPSHHPTQVELRQMTENLAYIAALREDGPRAMPTFLLMKLCVMAEETLDMLITRRFPEQSLRQMDFEDKLKVLSDLDDLDIQAFRNLKRVRHRCVHDLTMESSWEELDRHLADITGFVTNLERTSQRDGTRLVKGRSPARTRRS